jgi:cytoskeletal protein RodZ
MSFLDLNDISDHLSIPVPYLKAIEENNFSSLRLDEQIIEKYIVQYADFLETDAEPIIQTFHQIHGSKEVTFAPRSRGKRVSKSTTKQKRFFYTYRYYLIGSSVCLILSFIIWFFVSNGDTNATKSSDQSVSNTTPNPTTNKDRPVFTLQKTSASSLSNETWYISQADTIHLQIQALGDITIQVKEDGSEGEIIASKELTKSQSFDLQGKKWITIQLDNPSNALLKVNDVVIDSVAQKSKTTYEFKIASN